MLCRVDIIVYKKGSQVSALELFKLSIPPGELRNIEDALNCELWYNGPDWGS